jgi:hypothetical protein
MYACSYLYIHIQKHKFNFSDPPPSIGIVATSANILFLGIHEGRIFWPADVNTESNDKTPRKVPGFVCKNDIWIQKTCIFN